MAVHNGAPFLEESIRSILGQSYSDFEFVIGDDGSNDGSGEILARLAAEDDRIRLLRRSERSGLVASANWVVSEARAPLVAIAHADDLSRPLRLQRQVAVFDRRPDAALVGALADAVDAHGRWVQPSPAWRLRSRAPFAPFAHSTVMFRKSAFVAAGGYRSEAEYWEDFDLYLRILEHGKIMVVPEELGSVRYSGISTRLRNDSYRVYAAVDRMYRTAEAYPSLHGAVAERRPGGKLHPRSFVARGSILLWGGKRPRVLGHLLRWADLRPNLASLHALVWAVWAAASPGTLRVFIRTIARLRNFALRLALSDRRAVEWQPNRGSA